VTRPRGAPRGAKHRPRPRPAARTPPPTPFAGGDFNIDSLAHGGAGVGRCDGRVLFVPGAVPGDRIRATEVSWRGGGAYGQVVQFELASASPLRRPAQCPHRPRCGGCPWHEIDPATRAQAKIEDAISQLQRIAHLDAVAAPRILDPSTVARWGRAGHSIVRVDPDWGYRLRARLHVGRTGDRVCAGYLEQGSHVIVDVERCGLLLPVLGEPTSRALELARSHAWPTGQLHVAVGVQPLATGAAFIAERVGPLDQVARDLQSAGFDLVEVADGDATIRGGADPVAAEALRGVVAPEVAGGPFAHGTRTFVQAHAAGNRQLVDAVVRCTTELGPGTVLELHAGAGNFTLPLARSGAHVRAVEFDERAVEFLRNNLDQAGLRAAVEVVAGDARAVAQTVDAAFGPIDLLVLDPPRTGYKELEVLVSTTVPKRIIYCSCDATTLARDGRGLTDLGYRLARFDAIDMMPNGWHAELVAVFDR